MKYAKSVLISALAVLLAACGSGGTDTAGGSAEPQDAAAESGEAAEGTAVESYPGMTGNIIIPDDPSEFNYESFTAIDNDLCTVTFKDIDATEGFAINFELENKSPDNYTFMAESVSVNGMAIGGGYMYTPVSAGQKTETPLQLGYIYKEWGVGKYTDIEITMVVRTEYYSEEPVARETFHIYPYGEDKAEKFVREPMENDKVLIDNDMVKLIFSDNGQLNTVPPEYGAMMIHMYIENKTDQTFSVSIADVSVNDYMMRSGSPMLTLNAERCGLTELYLEGAQLAECDIEKIEEVEFELGLFEPNGYEPLYTEIVTLTP